MSELSRLTPTRRCSVTGRELKTGETFYAAVIDDGATLVRRDFAADAWPGPPEQAVAYWVGRVPATDTPARPPCDDDLLVDCLRRLDGSDDPDHVALRYVIALLLMRRKRLRLEEERDDLPGSVMVFHDAKGGGRFEIRDPGLTADDLRAAQDELFRLLGWD